MADEPNEPKNQTRSYVYNTVWKSLRDESKPDNAPATALRRKLMIMVLAAGSYAVIDSAPELFENDTYRVLNRGDVNSGEWKSANWSVFFRSRGAILLLREDIMAFLLDAEMMDRSLSYTLNTEGAISSFTDPSLLSVLRPLFQSAPAESRRTLETAAQMLEIIGQPNNDSIQVLKEYDRHIRVLRTQDSGMVGTPERLRSRDCIVSRSGPLKPLVLDSDRRPFLRPPSRNQSVANTSSSSKRRHTLRSPINAVPPLKHRIRRSVGPSLSDVPWKLQT